ncbi:FAD binding domain-containing protein [Dongia sp.]|uniref:FAD binding domain-containing protein n=1 Tax=Dongia sp. TaxID=1977262 RepID=UPI00375197A7
MLRAIDVPRTTAEAVSHLARARDALVIGGGTLVMPKVQAGLSGLGSLVSLSQCKLDRIAIKGEKVTIGAATTLAAIGEERGLAFLHPAIESVGSPTLRNLATIGGNLFTEQPYGDIAVCLLALNAEATVATKRGVKKVSVAEILLKGVARDAIVTAVSFKRPEKGSWFYRKAMRRAANSASIVTIAAHLPQKQKKIGGARIALGGCGAKPVLAVKAAAALEGQKFDAEATAKAGALLIKDAAPFTDAYASAWYRARVLPVHFRRAILGE